MSDILPFPPRNKGRIRITNSIYSMGRCALGQFDGSDKSVPENVADIRVAKPEPIVGDERLSLRLALAVFAVLSEDQKGEIEKAVRMYARHKDGVDGDECRVLYKILTGGTSC